MWEAHVIYGATLLPSPLLVVLRHRFQLLCLSLGASTPFSSRVPGRWVFSPIPPTPTLLSWVNLVLRVLLTNSKDLQTCKDLDKEVFLSHT